jgi:hypothetical protein
MDAYRLSADEIACVKKPEELFEKNESWVTAAQSSDGQGNLVDPLGLPPEKREAILSVMEHMGLLDNVTHYTEGRYFNFRITPKVLQVARAIREEEAKKDEPGDIVEQVKSRVRSNRFIAWGIIVFGGLTVLITLLNQLLQLLKTLGVWKAP